MACKFSNPDHVAMKNGELPPTIGRVPCGTQVTTMALELGTLASDDVRHSLRGDHWLHNHPEASAAQAYAIKRRLRDAFYCDNDGWKGRVYGQFKAAALQAIMGLGSLGHAD